MKPPWNWKDSKFHLHQYLPKQAEPAEECVLAKKKQFLFKDIHKIRRIKESEKSALVYICSLCYSVAVILYVKSDVQAINILMLTSQTII